MRSVPLPLPGRPSGSFRQPAFWCCLQTSLDRSAFRKARAGRRRLPNLMGNWKKIVFVCVLYGVFFFVTWKRCRNFRRWPRGRSRFFQRCNWCVLKIFCVFTRFLLDFWVTCDVVQREVFCAVNADVIFFKIDHHQTTVVFLQEKETNALCAIKKTNFEVLQAAPGCRPWCFGCGLWWCERRILKKSPELWLLQALDGQLRKRFQRGPRLSLGDSFQVLFPTKGKSEGFSRTIKKN